MFHLFTVDVEEYFQVSAFEGCVAREDWPNHPSRLTLGMDRLLALLERHGVLATFFILGWIAKHHPDLVRRIAAGGHEVASHGWWHRRVTSLTHASFRDEVRDSRSILQDLTGQPVLGYRAPSFSIEPETEWAFDVLLEEGYRYDSSLFPGRQRGPGGHAVQHVPHLLKRATGVLLELPLASMGCAGLRVPAAGGGYLRQLPFAVIRHAFRRLRVDQVPAVFYIHPWELDPDQPRIPAPWLTQLRHYRGLGGVQCRIEALLTEFPFTSVSASRLLDDHQRPLHDADRPR